MHATKRREARRLRGKHWPSEHLSWVNGIILTRIGILEEPADRPNTGIVGFFSPLFLTASLSLPGAGLVAPVLPGPAEGGELLFPVCLTVQNTLEWSLLPTG